MGTQVGMKTARGMGRSGFVAVLGALMTVLVSGCVGLVPVHVDPGDLPGVYRNDDTGAEIRLEAGGRFSAVGFSQDDVEIDGGTALLGDFGGTWDPTPSNFVYLEPEPDGMSDIQLWTVSSKKVYLQPDVDGGPITLTLVKVKGS
ncbi:hypothetical protein [Streptomyces hydrogenans]|uniref:hypothetical protein n=1 Tax=Streptomyces hydrogenans TaxID=1873719 RepID=UPI00278C103C|nr:hypothetical protein [Streptomyces hydrogenans]